jgi:cytochrome c oxidase assembly factor CtaG
MSRLIVLVLVIAASPTAAAHHAGADGRGIAASALEWGLVVVLGATAVLYAAGVRALWRKAGPGRGIRRRDVVRFVGGWMALALALVSPIDALAEQSFAMHMAQHELLMVVAAPLIVLGRPLEAWAWALPLSTKRSLAAAARLAPLRGLWWMTTVPLGAWCLHAAALWIWHVPLLFRAALASLPVHVLQHACFLFSALGFWWAAFGGAERRPDGSSVASLFTTMLHTSALGALLTFAPTAWYAGSATPALAGLSPLEDQQLGGLIMWVPGGVAYMIAGLAIVGAWLGGRAPGYRDVEPAQR